MENFGRRLETPEYTPAISVPGDGEEGQQLDIEDAITTVTEDGGAVVQFGEEEEDLPPPGHKENLAKYMEEAVLQQVASDLLNDFSADERARKDWLKAYLDGLDLLGFKSDDRTTPWRGACGVYHPLLTEAVLRFQAQTMSEVFPASGPARTLIVSDEDPEVMKQARRVETEMNYLLTEKMQEYRTETEHLMFRLPLAGSAFRKVYYNEEKDRPASMFVPAEDFVIAYGASDLTNCPRYTHIMKMYPNELRKLQVSGFYLDTDIPEPAPEYRDVDTKHDKMEGSQPTVETDDRHTVLEMHVEYDLPGFEDENGIHLPYVITIEKSSQQILSIYRNWREQDPKQQKRIHFVHYPYMPGLGYYGTGLTHVIGGLAKSATSIIRQLVDAGTLANLPAGLKARGLRIKGDDEPLAPGTFKDVDVPSGAIKDAITFVPYKEPSAVLYNLLTTIVEEGRRIGSIADLKISDMSAQAPVGTTLALLERNLKVMSAIQARVHASMRQEFKLIAEVVSEFMGPRYDYDQAGKYDRQKDFSDRNDIIPVSDPNATTMSQRVVQYQAALQLAGGAPDLYDRPLLHRQMLEVLGIKNAEKIVKLPDEHIPMDPVSENMAILTGKPVKAFLYQDHEAHLAVHMSAAQDPKILALVGQSPQASMIQGTLAAHVSEHLAMAYRRQIEEQMGVALPPPNEPLPEDVEVALSRVVAEAAKRTLSKNKAEEAQKKAEEAAQDPVIQIQQKELEIKAAEVQRKAERDKADVAAKLVEAQAKAQIEAERIASEERQTAATVAAQLSKDTEDRVSAEKIEAVKAGIKLVDTMAKKETAEKAAAKKKASE